MTIPIPAEHRRNPKKTGRKTKAPLSQREMIQAEKSARVRRAVTNTNRLTGWLGPFQWITLQLMTPFLVVLWYVLQATENMLQRAMRFSDSCSDEIAREDETARDAAEIAGKAPDPQIRE
jgi:hypothetical protein